MGADPKPFDSRGVSGEEAGMGMVELTALVVAPMPMPMPMPIQLLRTSIVVKAAAGVVAVVGGGDGEAIHGTGPAGDATVLA